MPLRRLAIALALAGLGAACSDQTGPLPTAQPLPTVQAPFFATVGSDTAIHVLQQSPNAPALETYQLTFIAPVNRPTTVTVNYQPLAGDSVGQPFLRLDILKHGIVSGPDGASLSNTDSVAITLTIDPVNFVVEFRPSGLVFSAKDPATLAVWYGNANFDLNGNGVVDGWDRNQLQTLGLWYRTDNTNSWFKSLSANDPTQLVLSGPLFHFSEYSASW